MYNIHDIKSRCSQYIYIYGKHNSKHGMKNAKFLITNQHMNATCHMKSLEKDFYIGTLGG
jgi:hypothetical protein